MSSSAFSIPPKGRDAVFYGGLNAKVMGLKSQLLSPEDYDSLSKLSTVEAVAAKLKERPAYESVMAPLTPESLHRNIIESRLFLSLSEEYQRIHSFINDSDIRGFLDAYFLQYDITLLKLLLCMVYDERSVSYTAADLQCFLGRRRKIDLSKLAAAKTVSEFLECLKGTELYGLLHDLGTSGNPSLFDMEMQLDLYYYINFWKALEKVSDSANKSLIKQIKGTEVDLRNILWVYRLKNYYHVPEERIIPYLIPISYKLTAQELLRLAKTKTTGEFMTEIGKTRYGKIFEGMTSPERVFFDVMSGLYRQTVIRNRQSLAPTISYIYHKEREIKNITSLLEGVRYSLPPAEIMAYIFVEPA